MKKLFCLLLAAFMLLCFVPVSASAASSSATLTEGEYGSMTFGKPQDGDCLIGVAWVQGSIPDGMNYMYGMGVGVTIYGTPTKAGTYVSYWTLEYDIHADIDYTVTITVQSAPKILQTPTPTLPVMTRLPNITITATPAPTVAPTAAPTAAPKAAVITKHPGGETVTEGESAMFTAGADNYKSMVWRLVSADTKVTVTSSEASSYFSGLGVSTWKTNSGREAIELSNIPKTLDGWKVEAKFIGDDGNAVFTNGAKIIVNSAAPAPTVTPQPTNTPQPTSTPLPVTTPIATVTTAPSPSPTPNTETEHEHTFSGEWKYDALSHWRECACGERVNESAHVMSWVSGNSATEETGVCPVCGYSTTRTVEKAEKNSLPLWPLLLLAVVAVALVAVAITLAIVNSKSKAQHKKVKTAVLCCRNCGWRPKKGERLPVFCPECGEPFDDRD